MGSNHRKYNAVAQTTAVTTTTAAAAAAATVYAGVLTALAAVAEESMSIYFSTSTGVVAQIVSSPSATTPPNEPRELFASGFDLGIDGTSNIDITLANDGTKRSTIITAATETAGVRGLLDTFAIARDANIDGVFTFNGATNNYTFVPAAITGAGASLWGGDGANGQRGTAPTLNYNGGTGHYDGLCVALQTGGGSGGFAADDVLLTYTPSSNQRILAVNATFDADGADKVIVAQIKVDGTAVYGFPIYDDGLHKTTEIVGRLNVAASSTVELVVASANTGGGTVQASFIYANI